jgi:fumarate hydratase subunit beta
MVTEYHLKTPLSDSDVRMLEIADIIYLSGIIYTARDEAHIHILRQIREGHGIDISLEGAAIYHCGPIVRKEDSQWKVVAAGPTTSSRMNSLEPEFIERTLVRAVIGKGGMSRPVAEAMGEHGAVYLAFTGGAAVLAADSIRNVRGVYLEELGMPEAMWILEANNLGPLIVGIDTRGQSLFDGVSKQVKINLLSIKRRLGLQKDANGCNLTPSVPEHIGLRTP